MQSQEARDASDTKGNLLNLGKVMCSHGKDSVVHTMVRKKILATYSKMKASRCIALHSQQLWHGCDGQQEMSFNEVANVL